MKKDDFVPIFFFGYGSLLRKDGINGRGMAHRYTNEELIPARLHGYERSMCAYLNINNTNYYGLLPKEDSTVNGMLLSIHDAGDYRAFLASEFALPEQGNHRAYVTVPVTDRIEFLTDFQKPQGQQILTLVCPTDKREWGSIKRSYVHLCDNFAQKWGEDFYQEFLNTGGMNDSDWVNYNRIMTKNGRRV